MVQQDYDEELGPLHGMYGSMEAEFEVQRTIKRAHVDNKGITDGLWGGERKCIDPKAGDADLWIEIWEELRL